MPGGDRGAPRVAGGPRQTGRAAGWGRGFAKISERLEARFDAERDQLPLWLPVGLGLGLGIAAWFALPGANAWTAFLLAGGALLFAMLGLGLGTRWGKAVALFAFAAALGCAHIWWKAERVAAPGLEYARTAELTAKIESFQPLPSRETVSPHT